MVTIHSAMLSR